jgi:hypothetical protein
MCRIRNTAVMWIVVGVRKHAPSVNWRTIGGTLSGRDAWELAFFLTLGVCPAAAAQQLRPPIDNAPSSPPCAPLVVDTTGWTRYNSQIAPVSLSVPGDFTLYRQTAEEEWLRGVGDFTFRSIIIKKDTTYIFGYRRFDGTWSPEPSPEDTCSATINAHSIRLAAYQTSGYTHAYTAEAAWPLSDGLWVKLQATDARHDHQQEMQAVVRSLKYRR